MTPTLPNPANRAENLTRLCGATICKTGWRMVQSGVIRSRQKVVQLLAEILGKGSQGRFRNIATFAAFAASIGFSRWQPQPPGRLKDRRVVNSPAAAPRPLLIVAKGLTPHWRTFRRREYLSGYRSRQARVGATEAIRTFPRARSQERRRVKILELPAGQQFTPFQDRLHRKSGSRMSILTSRP